MKLFQIPLLFALILSGQLAKAQSSEYCEKTVTHFNIEAETPSAINLTITNIDATSMYVEIESADTDPVDLLIVNNGSGATISEAEVIGSKIRRTLTYTTAPTEVSIELLWSKVSMGGNWMLNTFTVPFAATCGGVVVEDLENPTAFTATLGEVGPGSVELLLNANDNSGAIKYDITYGTTTLTTNGTSGIETSFVVNDLNASTAYTFSVLAKDAAGNVAANNPIEVAANTTEASTVSAYCEKTVTHFNIEAETPSAINLTISNIDATSMYVEIESADADPVDLLIVNNGSGATFSEAEVIGNKIRRTLTYTTAPTEVSLELLWSKVSMGGNWMLNTFTVPFGASCGPVEEDLEIPTAFNATSGTVSANSIELLLFATDNSGSISYEITYGTTTLTTNGASGVETSFIVNELEDSTAYTFSVVAKDAAGNEASNAIEVMASTTKAAATPTPAPVPPSIDAVKVISIFSNAFTDVAGTNFNPLWDQKTVVTPIDIEGNSTLKYENLDYQGTSFGSDVNALTMKYLHVDVWTTDETSLDIFAISRSTGEKPVSLTPLNLGTWNSFNILLSDFTSQELSIADLFQFKFIGSGGKTIYIDNLYFYDDSDDVDSEAPTAFTATKGEVTYESVELLLKANDNSGAVKYMISYGDSVLETSGVSDIEKSFIVMGLTGSSTYTFSVEATDIAGNEASNNPIEVSATTTETPRMPNSAPMPPALGADKVISIFSNAFTDVAGSDFNPNWNQLTVVSTVDIEGNPTLKYKNLNYQGTNLGSDVNADGMKYLHVDVWTADETSLEMFPISRSTGEKPVSLTPLNVEEWNSFDIPLSAFTAQGLSMSDLHQLKFVGSGGKTIYLDNIYFYDAIGNFPLDFETGTYDITNFDGGALTVIDNTQSMGINTSAKVGQMVKNAGQHWAGSLITLDNPIDFSEGNTFEMKVYSPKVGAKVLFKVENEFDNHINYEKEVSTTLANEWETLHFDYSDIDLSKTYHKIVLIFELGTAGDGSANFTYLLDDIQLVQVTAEGPLVSAPTPPVYEDVKVISIFSDAYTDLDGTNFNPFWQQATIGSIEDLEEGKILKLKNLNYQGIELLNEVNAASMTHMHIDAWTANETLLEIYPISKTTGEKKVNLTPLTQNEWNSYDIKLSDLTTQGFTLADLFQFKFIGSGEKTVYIDNLYLYDNRAGEDTEAPQGFTVSKGTVTYNSIQLLMNATDNSGAVNYTIKVGEEVMTVGGTSGVEASYEFTKLPSSTTFNYEVSVNDPSGNEAADPIQISATTDIAFPVPTIASPRPPVRNAEDVISILSDVYTNVPNSNFNPWWQQSTWYFSVQVGGNEVVKYENFNYQGIEFGNSVDASGLDYLHIDVWTPNETSLSISPITSTGEKAYNVTPVNINEWNSYDIPLSAYTNQGLSLNEVLHLKMVGSGKSIIYVDNIYFYKGTLTSTKQIENEIKLSVYPNPAKDVVTIATESALSSMDVLNLSGSMMVKITSPDLNSTIDISQLPQGTYLVRAVYVNGAQSVQKLVKE